MLIDQSSCTPPVEDLDHLSDEVRRVLMRADWPYNIHELQNVIERVFSLAPAGELSGPELAMLVPELRATRNGR